MIDVLEALEPFREHALYPKACGAVLKAKRESGVAYALGKADQIAEAMGDAALEKRLK